MRRQSASQGGDHNIIVQAQGDNIHVQVGSESRLTPFDLFATVPPPPANHIPRPEITQPLIEDLLSRPGTVALTAIEGMGGIGKTMVANEICHDTRIRIAFPDGILWLTLGKQRGLTTEDLTRQMAQALNQEFKSYTPSAYRSLFLGRSVLVVLDDVWTLDAIEPFLLNSGNSRLLYTTRVREIAASLGAKNRDVSLLDGTQARIFLARWSGRDSQPLPEPQATKIIAKCKGLALGVAMIGASLRNKPAADWARVVRNLKRARLRDTGVKVGNHAYRTLYSSISASIEELSPEDKGRYLKLSILLEDMPATAVLLQQICGADRDEVEALMGRLVDVSLASFDAEGSILLHDFQLDFIRGEHPDPVALALQHSALLRSIDVVRSHPEQFASQMIGRLLPHAREPGIAVFIKDLDAFEKRPRIRSLIPTLDAACSPVLRVLEGHLGSVHAVALTPDGRFAVSGSADKTLRVWDLYGTQPPRVLEGHTGSVYAVALTPGGRLAVSGSEDKTLRVWDLHSKKPPRVLEGHIASVIAVAITPDGKVAVSGSVEVFGSADTMRVWDLDGKKPSRVLEGHLGSVHAVALTPDGKLAVSGSSDMKVRVWDLEGNKPPRVLEGHTDFVRAVALTPDGKLAASGSDDGTLRVWNLDGNKPPRVLGANEDFIRDGVNAVALTPDGRLAICGYDRGDLRVWELTGNKSPRVLEGHIGYVFAVALTPDGSLAVSGSRDKTLRVWDLESARVLNRHTTSVHAVVLTPDGGLGVSGSPDGMLRAWNLVGTQTPRLPGGYPTRIDALALTPDGKLALSNSDWKLRLWDLDGNKPPRLLEGHEGIVVAVALTPDGSRAVAGSNYNSLWVWDLNGTQPPRVLEGHTDTVFTVELTHDGRLAVSGSEDMTVRVWDLEGNKPSRVLEGHTGWVSSVAVTPDGCRAVSGSYDNMLRVWDLDSNKALRVLEGHTDIVCAVALTPDGRLAVSGSKDNTIRVWNLDGTEPPSVLEGHTARVEAVAVTPDGQLAVSGSQDKTLRVWNLEEGKCVATFTCDAVVRSCWCLSNDIAPGDGRGQVSFFLWGESEVEAQP